MFWFYQVPAYIIKASAAANFIPKILDGTDSSIVLDIDEDFYGVMKGTELVPSVNFSTIEEFNDLLSKIFIIKNVKGME